MKLEVRKDPCGHSGRQREAGDEDRTAGHAKRLEVRLSEIRPLVHGALHAVEDVDPVIDTDPDTQSGDGQRRLLQANPEQGHEGVTEHGDQAQGQDDAEGDAPGTEGEQAERDDRGIDVDQDPELGGLHHLHLT